MFWRRSTEEGVRSGEAVILSGNGNHFSGQGIFREKNFPSDGSFAGRVFPEEMNFLDDRNFPDDENPPVERNFPGTGIFGQGEVVGGEISPGKERFSGGFCPEHETTSGRNAASVPEGARVPGWEPPGGTHRPATPRPRRAHQGRPTPPWSWSDG